MNNPLIENNILLIIAGVSGSGKSTFADFLEFMIDSDQIEICTADDYHMVDGEYQFKIENLPKAHKWCQQKADSAMNHDVKLVIVNNTSTSLKEREVYKDLAKKHNYEVCEIIMNNDYDNIHNVPNKVLQTQKQKLLNSLK
jgi:predicted kinase